MSTIKRHWRIIPVLSLILATLSVMGCGRPTTVGLHPLYPPVVRKGYSLMADFVAVETLTPTFRWQALAIPPTDASTPAVYPRIDPVTYEIRIWRTTVGERGKLVVRRDGLTATDHRVAQPLEPDTRYLWSVRAHFMIDGRRRTTEWSLAGYLLRNEAVPNDACLRFKTP